MIERSKDNSNLLPLKKLSGGNDSEIKLFEIIGIGYDADRFNYMRVARSESELRDRLQKEEHEDENSTQHYGLFIHEIKEIDGYEVNLSKIK